MLSRSKRAQSSGRVISPPIVIGSRHSAFTLVELLVVIAIIGILVALLLPAIQAAREAARRAQCQSNIKNVALAVLNYESSRKELPNGMTFDPAINNPVHTMSKFGPNWIIDILPNLEDQAIADRFDKSVGINEPGANNRNIDARGTTIPVLLCPSDPFNQVKYQGHGGNWARGNYAASAGRAFVYGSTNANQKPPEKHMSGPHSLAWSGKDWMLDTLYCWRGVMGPNAAVTLKQITDGMSKTIMLAEIRAGLTETDPRGVWALGHAGASLVARYGANGDANGPNACYSNSDDVPGVQSDGPPQCGPSKDTVGAAECMTVSTGGSFDQAGTRSKHQGGVHVAMADGSVQFVNDDIETSGCYGGCCTVWDWMITSADGGQGGAYNGASGRGPSCEPK
jgi:prepilin-type N-terminal cleavage/methylation domain-containing protein/prepilin-type processing-associated H-X9-DG protein